MKSFGHFYVVLILGLSAQVQSQEAIPTVADVRAKYEAAVEEMTKPLDKFQDRYYTELAKLQDSAQQAGQLDLILEIQEEANAFRSGKLKPTTDPELLKLRQIYSEEVERLAKVSEVEIANLQSLYQEQLQFIQVEQTKAGNVKVAVAARDEHKRVSALAAKTKDSQPANSVGTSAAFTMVEKDERNSETLSDWLIGTVWKAGFGWRIKFLDGGKASKISPEGEISGGTTTTNEDDGHVVMDWEKGPTLTLEISEAGERLNDRSHSTTWVRQQGFRPASSNEP